MGAGASPGLRGRGAVGGRESGINASTGENCGTKDIQQDGLDRRGSALISSE